MRVVLYLLVTFLLALSVPQAASAQTGFVLDGIRVEGAQRIEERTIISYLDMRPGSEATQEAVDKALKNLFATGFFSDVKILRAGNSLVVRVQENPIINRVAFEGNERIETKDLEAEVELKPRTTYSRTKVQNDVKRILDIYRKSGRYTATVEPKVISLDQNRIDLVFEISEGIVSRIKKITFIGNNVFSSSELEGIVRSSETRWYQFLTDDDKYDPDRLQYDQELLRRYYSSQGYADFQIKSAHAELTPAKDSFYLTFVVEEGPQYTINKMEVQSELKGPDKPELDKFITTKAGDVYNATMTEESVDAITKELGNLGYAFVDVQPRLKRDREKKQIDLTYLIKPGPRVYVERINIVGNVRTLDSVIRREFRVAEGDPYNSSKISRSEQRLNNLGYFEKVHISNEPGSAPDKTVITVEVQEKSTGEINLGAGFSSRDGALADIGLKETNFLGRGQELRTRFTYASRRKQAELGFTEPYFLNRELSAGFDIFRTQLDFDDEASYNLNSTGGRLSMGYSLRERLTHSVYYSYRSNDITDIRPGASRYIIDQEGKHTNSAVGHAIVYDDRNNKFNPSNGYYLKLSQEYAGIGGDANYLRHEARSSYYYPIAKSWTWSVSGAGGHLLGLGGEDIRISDRFYLGSDLVRGFDNSGIGPRDVLTRDALGGNFYYAGNTELGFPMGLPEDLGFLGAVFLDFGSLWDVDSKGPEVFDSSSVRVSAGFGVSWASPFGPIRVDVAKPIVKEDVDEEELIRFSFGTRF